MKMTIIYYFIFNITGSLKLGFTYVSIKKQKGSHKWAIVTNSDNPPTKLSLSRGEWERP